MFNLKRLLAKALIFIATTKACNECNEADVYDVTDIRDKAAPILSGPPKGLPKAFDLGDKMKKYPYKPTKQGDSECTGGSKIYQNEILNSIWNDKLVKLDKDRQWRNQLESGAMVGKGDSILNAQKQFHKDPQGYPQYEYLRMREKGDELIHQIKLWVYLRFCPVQTGAKWRSLDGISNYNLLKHTGEYVPNIGGRVTGAHAWIIRGWDEAGWIIKESLLNKYGDNIELGVFHINYEYTDGMFSKYVVRDAIDKQVEE